MDTRLYDAGLEPRARPSGLLGKYCTREPQPQLWLLSVRYGLVCYGAQVSFKVPILPSSASSVLGRVCPSQDWLACHCS